MKLHSALVACGALTVLCARSGYAQQVASAAPAPAATVVLVDGKSIGAADAWGAKPVGSYDIVIPMSSGMMIATLNIAEANGKLGATITPLGEDRGMPLEVAVSGTNLELTLKREHGPITVSLQHRGGRISGNWVVGGMDSGTLEGVAKK